MNATNSEYREGSKTARRFFLFISIFFVSCGFYLLHLKDNLFAADVDKIIVLTILWSNVILFSALSLFFVRVCYLSIKSGVFPGPNSYLPSRHRIYNDWRVLFSQLLTALISLFHIVFALLIIEFIYCNY